MKMSVVINTYNRARSLEQTLRALVRQTWRPFEVVVVNGPSTDGTDALLQRWSGLVRTAHCPARHLGLSRNIGIEAAAGDVVAFIDDDAIPEPDWLAELAAGYDDDRVAGVGGIVFDHTGMRLQYRFSVCDRVGNPTFDVVPPFTDYVRPGADPFVYLQGTNASFRRHCLEEIGGFDEEIEFYLDETEVCLQLLDRGYELRPVPNAAVHHHYLPSHLRIGRRVWIDPYPAVKNRLYFSLSHGLASRSHADVLRVVLSWLDGVTGAAQRLHESGELTDEQLATFISRAALGVSDGLQRGLARSRKSRELAPPDPAAFHPLPTVQAQGPRLRICFLTEDYPPGPVGGIGRFTADLAAGLAVAGHEVHVVTRSPDTNRVDVEDDVWVHRIAVQQRRIPAFNGSLLIGNLLQGAAFYHEVRRIHERLPLSVVSAPGWNAQAFLCVLDRSFPTITSLHTSLRTITDVLTSWEGNAEVQALLRLEAATLRESRELHANSRSALEVTNEQFPGLSARAHVLPHGLADRAGPELEPIDRDGRLRVLFVGRLERRKGVDVLLSAAPELLERHPDAELVIVGRDTPHTELGETYREWFHRQHAGDPGLRDRVRFVGEVDDHERDRWYASSDVFCAPSRYESFGLVLLEAMAHGLPVVSCDAGGVAEIVDGNGLLAQPGDPASLLDCLDRLLSDTEMRHEMGRRSRELFEKTWSLGPWVERVAAAYTQVAADHRPEGEGIDADRLAGLLAEVGAVPAERAAEAAAELLDPMAYPVDEASRLVDLLVADDETFVRGCYEMLLGRDAEDAGLRDALGRLRGGEPRLDYVENMARSNEARQRGVDLAWLPKVPPLWSDALLALVGEVLERPDPEFCEGVYRLVLQREPDPEGRRGLLGHLANGGDRLEAVRTIALSDEARRRRVPSGWLDQLPQPEAPSGDVVEVAAAPALGRRAKDGARRVARGIDRRLGSPWARRRTTEASPPEAPARAGADPGLVRTDRGLRSMSEDLRALTAAVRDMNVALASLPDALAESQRKTAAAVTSAVEQIAGRVTSSTEAVTKAQRNETATIIQWLDVMGRKQEAMALELRERLPPVAETSQLPEPVVVDPERLQALVESGRPIRLNLGCGEKPLPGYVNVDARPLPDVDVVADARRLPFGPESVDEVASHHLVEHFRNHHLRSVVLPYWRDLLRPGGLVKVVCPNWSAMIDLGAKGEIGIADLAQVTFGMQDYQGDDHFAMYSPEMLAELLEEAGFEGVDVVAEERRNGLSIEMELWARKPGGGAGNGQRGRATSRAAGQ